MSPPKHKEQHMLKKIAKFLARTVQVLLVFFFFVVGFLNFANGSVINKNGDLWDDEEAHQQMNIGLILIGGSLVIAFLPDFLIAARKKKEEDGVIN